MLAVLLFGSRMKHSITVAALALLVAACHGGNHGNAGQPTGGQPGTPSDSTPPSLGPIAHAGGTSFRVWAPDAAAVDVVGDFGDRPLAATGDGTWWADVAGAHDGQHYRYAVQYQGQTLVRADPRSYRVAPHAGEPEPDSIIYDQR